MQSQDSSSTINIQGSSDIVSEFFMYSVNNILYQRAIYPPETFRRVSQYGLPMMITTDEKLNHYIGNIMKQLKVWLSGGNVQKLVLVVKGTESGDILERWVFNCFSNSRIKKEVSETVNVTKSQKELTQEIQAIIRQITSCVTFLPILNEPCVFDLLVYADNDSDVPSLWEDSDPCCVINAEDVKLRSFTTKIHKVEAMVSYKTDN